MIEINYRRILIFQAFLLIAFAVFYESVNRPSYQIYAWSIFIVADLIFLKFFALPSTKNLKKFSVHSEEEDLSWTTIEESLTKKDEEQQKVIESKSQEITQLKELINLSQNPLCIITESHQILFSNNAFRELFNVETIPYSHPLIEVTRNLEFQDFLTEAIKNKSTEKLNDFSFNQTQSPDNTFYEIRVSPLSFSNQYACIFIETTDFKVTNQIREDFVANFSHEVRTPLTILHGLSQGVRAQLQEAPDFDEKFKNTFDKIDSNTKRVINLLSDLLRLASIEKTRKLKKEEIFIEESIQMIAEDLISTYPNKKIELSVHLNQLKFHVDFKLFEQVCINLIDNAIKYIPETGKIEIFSEQEIINETSYDILQIKDNGVGIPEDQLNRIFERFFRIDSSRSSEGTGLGLAIVKHIVQKHDGKIKVTSQLNKETVFKLFFPSAK